MCGYQRHPTKITGFVAGFEILHFPGAAGGNPFREASEVGEFVDGCDSGEIESGGEGGGFDQSGEVESHQK